MISVTESQELLTIILFIFEKNSEPQTKVRDNILPFVWGYYVGKYLRYLNRFLSVDSII